MKRLSHRLFVVVLLVAAAVQCAAQDANAVIRSEIDRLRKFAASQQGDNELWKDVKPGVERFLMLSETALKDGHVYFAVEELGKAKEMAASYQMTQQDPETLKRGLEGFESAWQKGSVELVALDKQAKRRDWLKAAAAMRALGESGHGQALTLLEASKAYASVTDPSYGYYYLGSAKANEQFGDFVQGLALKRTGTVFVPRTIATPLQKLQDRTNAAFVPPLSIKKHATFIRLNSMLKTAAELDQQKLYAGALYQYLQASLQFALLQPKAVDAAEQKRVRDAIVEARGRLAKSKQDESLAQMFVERAETLIATKGGQDASEEEWQNAAAVVDGVLPAYFHFENSRDEQIQQTPTLVTVTLVRWPYT